MNKKPNSDEAEMPLLALTRRVLVRGFAVFTAAASLMPQIFIRAQQVHASSAADDGIAWVCPMHSDYTAAIPGVCPLCGMTLVKARPFDVSDYRLEVQTAPARVLAGEKTTVLLRCFEPGSGRIVTAYNWVHTKQWHLFVISQDLEFFEHIHPVLADDGTWSIGVVLPRPGSYALLSDFFPTGGAAQFLARPLITDGYVADLVADGAHLVPDVAPSSQTSGDLAVRIAYDPPVLVAGMLCRVNFHLTDAKTQAPVRDLQTYLGAFGHALMVSDDLVSYVHVHPVNIVPGSDEDGAPPIFFISADADLETIRGGPDVALEMILPKGGLYRVWMQMRRHDQVQTFTLTFNAAPYK